MGFLGFLFLGGLLLSSFHVEAQFCDRLFRLFSPSVVFPPAHLVGEVKKLSYGKIHIGVQIQHPHQNFYKTYGDGMALLSKNSVEEGDRVHYSSHYSLDHRSFVLVFSASVGNEGESEIQPTIYTHYIYWISKSHDVAWESQIVKQIFEKLYGKNPLQRVKNLLFQKENQTLNKIKAQYPQTTWQDSRGNMWYYGGNGGKIKTYSSDITERGRNGVLEPFLFRTEKEKNKLKQVIMEVLDIKE